MGDYPLFHADCSQSFQFLDCDVRNLGIDLMTLSAHKIYGSKGAGILYVKHSVASSQYSVEVKRKKLLTTDYQLLDAQLTGGGQEFGLRSGTENVPAIVGFAKAVEWRDHLFIQTNEQMRILRDRLWVGIKKICPKAEINGAAGQGSGVGIVKSSKKLPDCPISQLPNILNVYFPGHDAQDLLTRFDLQGVAVSSGSACRSRATPSSYVIRALGYSENRAKSSIRFSLGRPTTKEEIDLALKIIKKIFP
jgi:cysteine desulfurase